MLITKPGIDIISIGEDKFYSKFDKEEKKVHLIKIKFKEPTKEKIDWLVDSFPLTNRFIISDNIKTYNQLLKETKKKYYIENQSGDGLFTFFRKNNKVLLNFLNLTTKDRAFILDNESILKDILRNLEIIYLTYEHFKSIENTLKTWTGNVIIYDNNYKL